MIRGMRGMLLLGTIVAIAAYLLLPVLIRPSLDRDWTADQKVLSRATFNDDDTVSIENIRNIDYVSTTTYRTAYYDASYDPERIVRAWFLVEPFGSMNAAHTLVSFEFDDGRFLSVSAEIRKENGESFSPVKGLFRQYELVYVVADERDVIRLRTNYRKDEVCLYPIRGDKERVKEVFLDMLRRANKLAENPEMYNTLTNNCTTNIVRHVRKFSEADIPWWDLRYLFPAHVDEVAYDAGLIDTNLSFADAQERFYITTKAQAADNAPDFSALIRK